jgi:predicted transcriptional regulator
MADLKTLTAEVVASYVENNKVAADELSSLIGRVYGALGDLDKPAVVAEPETVRKLTPAQIRKSISDDALISFEDGKSYRTLKRHLALHGLTPAAYRAKWGLPAEYPITAPSYSALRSAMALKLGLGKGGVPAAPAPVSPAAKASRAAKAAASKPALEAAPTPVAPAVVAAPKTRKPRAPKAIDPASDTFT